MDGVRPRARVTAAIAPYVYALRVVDKLPIYTSCETFGFPFGGASRLDESTLSEGYPRQLLVRPRTRHAHSRGLMGIIRRYYLWEGSHARIAVALLGCVCRILIHNYIVVYRPFFHPFAASLVLRRNPLEIRSKLEEITWFSILNYPRVVKDIKRCTGANRCDKNCSLD